MTLWLPENSSSRLKHCNDTGIEVVVNVSAFVPLTSHPGSLGTSNEIVRFCNPRLVNSLVRRIVSQYFDSSGSVTNLFATTLSATTTANLESIILILFANVNLSLEGAFIQLIRIVLHLKLKLARMR